MSLFIKEEKIYDAFRVPVPGIVRFPDGNFEMCKKGDWIITACDDITNIIVFENKEFKKAFIPVDRIEARA